MYKKTITYIDYDGNERKEDHFFNLNKAELVEMELTNDGGFEKLINKIIQERDAAKMINIFKEIILKSYGEKTPDGKRFVKSKELSEAFSQTEAYVNFYMELISDTEEAVRFVTNIIPAELAKEIDKNNTAQLGTVGV